MYLFLARVVIKHIKKLISLETFSSSKKLFLWLLVWNNVFLPHLKKSSIGIVWKKTFQPPCILYDAKNTYILIFLCFLFFRLFFFSFPLYYSDPSLFREPSSTEMLTMQRRLVYFLISGKLSSDYFNAIISKKEATFLRFFSSLVDGQLLS